MAASTYFAQVQQLYIAYFGRPADTIGQAYWAGQIDAANGSIASVIAGFSASAESAALFGNKSSIDKVTAIYQNAFGRAPEPTGLAYWVAKLDSGEVSQAQASWTIQQSAGPGDAAAVQNKLTAAQAFTAQIDTTAEIVGYQGAAAAESARAFLKTVTADNATATAAVNGAAAAVVAAAVGVVGQTFTLTTGINSVSGTAGNDTINAGLDAGLMTFSSLDAIDGGAGTDTLNLLSTGSLAGAAGATVKNVEIVNLTSAAAITAANVSGFTGLETLNVASGGAIAGVVAAATTDVNVLNGLAGVEVSGGNHVVINNGTAGDIVVGGGLTAGAAGNVTATNSFATGDVSVKGAGALSATANDGTITFTNGTTATAVASQAVAADVRTANLTAQTAADTANTAATAGTDASGLAKAAAAAKVTALATLATAITNATNVSADQATALSIGLATTTALGAKAITAAEKIAIDTAFAGAATVAAGKIAAQAVLTPLQTAVTAASTAAAAADVLNDAAAAAAKVAADAVVAADVVKNLLVDGVVVTATTNTTLASASISGNYGSIANAVTDGSTLSNVLTTVTLDNAGESTLTGKALTNVSAKGMSSNVTVANATVDHTQNFTLEAVTGGTYSDVAAKTVNIVSNGAASNVLTGLTATAATAVNLKGSAGLTFGTTTLAAAAVIDAAGSSGTNTITVGAGQTYTGGSGADVVTTNGVALQTKTVDGGAGSADRLNLANAADFATTGAAQFKNFEVLSLASAISADVTKFTNSTFTSVILNGGTAAVTGLNATQAGAITATVGGTYTVGVTGATTVGQLDTVKLTVDDGLAAVSNIVLITPVLAGVETLNLVANDHIFITALTSATALTNVNVTGAGTVTIASGALALNVNSVIDASAVNKTVTLDFVAGTGNGISLKAGDGDNALTGTDILGKGNSIVSGNGNSTITGGQADDVITVGNGNNSITAAAGNDTITAGNGNNTIGAASGNNTITVGNGWNVITTGAGADTITVGTGANVITAGAGADVIVLGASVAGTGNKIVIGDTDTGITVATADKITGFTTGADKLALGVAGSAVNYAEASVAVADFDAALVAANIAANTTVQFAFQFDGTNGYLFEDSDLDGTVDNVIVLVGATSANIAFADIIAA